HSCGRAGRRVHSRPTLSYRAGAAIASALPLRVSSKLFGPVPWPMLTSHSRRATQVSVAYGLNGCRAARGQAVHRVGSKKCHARDGRARLLRHPRGAATWPWDCNGLKPCPQLTPSLRCREDDEVVYWNRSFLPG